MHATPIEHVLLVVGIRLLQEPALLWGSLRENIALGAPLAAEAELLEVSSDARAAVSQQLHCTATRPNAHERMERLSSRAMGTLPLGAPS